MLDRPCLTCNYNILTFTYLLLITKARKPGFRRWPPDSLGQTKRAKIRQSHNVKNISPPITLPLIQRYRANNYVSNIFI